MLNQYSKLFFYNCVNLLQISSLHWLKKLWLRMACQGMKIILNLILLFIWFPGFPGIPGITSLKFPFPSLPVAICEFPFPSRKTGMWFSISLPVPGSQKAFPAHPCKTSNLIFIQPHRNCKEKVIIPPTTPQPTPQTKVIIFSHLKLNSLPLRFDMKRYLCFWLFLAFYIHVDF